MSMADPAPPKRIAFFLPDLGGGGAERVALAQIKELVARKQQVDLLLAFAGGALLSEVPRGVRIVEFGASRMATALFPLIRYLREARPHSLHALMWPLTVVAVVGRMIGSPRTRLMLSDHIALSRHVTAPLSRLLLRLTTRIFYPRADVCICVSEDAAKDLRRLSGLPRDAVRVIYNPLDLPSEIRARPEVTALWGSSKHRLLTVGSLKHQKNHDLLLRALAQSGLPDATLVILGEGELREALEQTARELGIADRVVFAGFDRDPWPFYAAADLFVLSSDYEGFANVVAEALYAGVAVVSTDCPAGPREILDDGKYGRLVPVNSVDELAEAIGSSIEDPVDRDALRARALEISGPRQAAIYADWLTA